MGRLVGGKWRMRGRDRGSGDGSEVGSVTKKKGKKSMTGNGASPTSDFRDKEEGNNMGGAISYVQLLGNYNKLRLHLHHRKVSPTVIHNQV